MLVTQWQYETQQHLVASNPLLVVILYASYIVVAAMSVENDPVLYFGSIKHRRGEERGWRGEGEE